MAVRRLGEPTRFARPTPTRKLVFTVGVVVVDVIPVFATIVGIAFAVVVDHEIILVQTLADNLLVPILVDFFVELLCVANLVSVEDLLTRIAGSAKLGELGALVELRHSGKLAGGPR